MSSLDNTSRCDLRHCTLASNALLCDDDEWHENDVNVVWAPSNFSLNARLQSRMRLRSPVATFRKLLDVQSERRRASGRSRAFNVNEEDASGSPESFESNEGNASGSSESFKVNEGNASGSPESFKVNEENASGSSGTFKSNDVRASGSFGSCSRNEGELPEARGHSKEMREMLLEASDHSNRTKESFRKLQIVRVEQGLKFEPLIAMSTKKKYPECGNRRWASWVAPTSSWRLSSL